MRKHVGGPARHCWGSAPQALKALLVAPNDMDGAIGLVAAALLNTLDDARCFVPGETLREAVHHPHYQVRIIAAKALGNCGDGHRGGTAHLLIKALGGSRGRGPGMCRTGPWTSTPRCRGDP